MSENPTVPEVTPSPKGAEPSAEPSVTAEDKQQLVDTLSKLDIKTPERIQNLANAGQQVGQLTNLLGEARNEITRLQMVNNQLHNQAPPQAVQPTPVEGDPRNVVPTPGSDFEARMWNVLNSFVGQYNQNQTNQAMKVSAEYEALGSHPDFEVVRKVFDEHVLSPAIQRKLLAGETSLKMEYANVRGDFMKNLALRSKDVVVGRTPAGAVPPHIEGPTGAIAPSPASVPTDSTAERTKNLADLKAQTKGSDNDIEALMKILLPDGDPHLIPKGNMPAGRGR